MKFTDVRDIIQSSRPSDWNYVPCWGSDSGPSYRTKWEKMTGPNSTWELHHQEHDHIAAYKPDVGVTLAWGMPMYADNHPEMTPDWIDKFPLVDSVSYYFIDVFWNGSVIDRDLYTVMDSRTYLPLPNPIYNETAVGSTAARERYEVTHYQVALARLVNNLANHQDTDFDQALNRTGFALVDNISE
ncbi:hypothetical protein CLV47_12322 [Antricoccus suffuscus]|uniref:Uncharacterized protein n=1 Tax=Antricoccus suffuscus TaxID=1629062 RepID=A0A2T0ZEK9_9ACTN|nr:hypothetical protein CLV47_12322 [Antricoccus suffuscus]